MPIFRPSVAVLSLTNPLIWQVLAVVLVVPALFSHLGYLPIDPTGDEPRRALVAIEMLLSGNYLTPTLNGEPYLNKPPLYNWLIAGSYRLFGDYSTFALRFPMAVSLVGFALTVFGFVGREQGRAVAFAAAFMLLTNIRVLLYDSLLGLIDITFSWVTYTAFMLVWRFDKRRQFGWLFVTTYVLTALGFLMKGLPAIVFQVLTLLGWFVYSGQFRRLFSLAHALGIAVFLAITGSYYWAYFAQNQIPIEQVAGVLFYESVRRTGLEFGVGETLLHLLTFPGEVFYRFAPWPLLGLLLVGRKLRPLLLANRFIAFNVVVFAANFWVYWSSPQVYARYLIMFLPLAFTVLSYVYYKKTSPSSWQRRFVDLFFAVITVVLTLGCWVPFLLPETRDLPGLLWKSALLSAALGLVAWQMWTQPTQRLLLMLLAMVLVRLAFNWFVLPPRAAYRQFYKDDSERAARLTMDVEGNPLPLVGYRKTIGDDGACDINSVYIETLRGQVLPLIDQPKPNTLCIIDSLNLAGKRYKTIGKITLFDSRPAKIVRFE